MPPGPLHTLLTLRTHDEDDARVAWTAAQAAAQAAADLLQQTNRAVEAGRDEVRQLEDRIGVHRSGRFTVADARRQHEDLADAEHRLASSVRDAALHHTRLLAARAEALKRQEAWAHARAERRAVTVGARLKGRAEITQGLAPGEMVITRGVQKVGDGRAVRVIEVEGEGAALSAAATPGA